MNGPNLLRVGHRIFNLDNVQEAQLAPAEPGRRADDTLILLFAGREDVYLTGADARATWRLLQSIRPLGDCDPPTPEEALAECYLVRCPATSTDGPHLWSAATLADLVARVASGWAPGPNQEYRIDLDGEIWGFLIRHDEKRWMIRQKDGSVTITSGAVIL